MEPVILQINTHGAWRNVCAIDIDADRRAELIRHLSALRSVLGDVKWCLRRPSGCRDYLNLTREIAE